MTLLNAEIEERALRVSLGAPVVCAEPADMHTTQTWEEWVQHSENFRSIGQITHQRKVHTQLATITQERATLKDSSLGPKVNWTFSEMRVPWKISSEQSWSHAYGNCFYSFYIWGILLCFRSLRTFIQLKMTTFALVLKLISS